MGGSNRSVGKYTIEYPLSQFIDIILDLDDTLTTQEVADEVGCSFDTAAAKLTKLEDLNEISQFERVGTTRWEINRESYEIAAEDVTEICDQIHNSESEIRESIDSSSITEIGSSIENWMQEHGFDQVNQPLRVFSGLAAFSFILKSTTYLDYQISNGQLPPFEADPQEIFQQFKSAFEITSNPAFAPNPLDSIIESVPENPIQPLIHIAYRLRNAKNPIAVIGKVYERIIPKSGREKRGQFRTPWRIAETLSQWAVEGGEDKILDPGAGTGVLSAAGYKSKTHIQPEADMNDIWSIDISSLSVLMTATGLQLSNGRSLPNVYKSDFMNSQPKYVSGEGWFNEPDVQLPTVDVVLSNPPYTRSKEIDNPEELQQLIKRETGKEFAPKTPLYQYFIVHAGQFLNQGGKMAVITSSSFLDANYGTKFQEYLLSEYLIDGVVLLGSEIEVFDADVSTVLLFLTKHGQEERPEAETALVRLQSWPSQQTILDIVNGNRSDCEVGECEIVQQSDLEPGHNWISSIGWNPNPLLEKLPNFESIADIERGVATGKNEYFCLNKEDIEDWSLSEGFRQPILRRPHHAPHYTFESTDRRELIDSNEVAWVLDSRRDGSPISNVKDQYLRSYLDHGKEAGANDSVLASRRSEWHALPSRDPPDIVVPYMNRDRVRFIANRTDAITLNNLHAIHLEEYTVQERNALLAYLNSNTASEVAIKMGRSYNRGLKKLELSDLRSLPVLDPNLLNKSQILELSDAFGALEAASREKNSLKEAEILAEIDTIVANTLQSLQS
jgi:adenine-specific DNA-methyltransferase